jgi:hypothetical protein
MTMLHPSAESLAHGSLEHGALLQHAGLGQATVANPRPAAAALLTQRSLNSFSGGSLSVPPGDFFGLQRLNPIPGGSGGMLDLSSMTADRNRAARSQSHLLMLLQDQARNAAAAAAVAASQFRTGEQMRFTDLPRQPDDSGWGPPNGRRF